MTARWGLAAAGPVSRSFVARVPRLARQLGPVTSTSYRLAARISNMLRAGSPVRTFAELQDAGILIFCFPGGDLECLIQLDALEWRRKIVLLCDTPNHARVDAELRKRGASVASIQTISELRDRYVIVGDRDAIRFARGLARSLRGRAVEIARERFPLFESALTLSSSLFTPLLETALESLRQSGLEQPEAAELADSLFQHSLRAFRHAGRKSWSGPVAMARDAAIREQLQALESKKPLMGTFFRDAVRYSFELYQTFPELTRYDKERWKEFQKRNKPSGTKLS